MPVIMRVAAAGVRTVVVDRNASAPGFAFADESVVASTHDAAAIIRELGQVSVLGVVNGSSGLPVVTAAQLCETYQVPSLSVVSAQTIIAKDTFLASCHESGIEAPRHFSMTSPEGVDWRVLGPQVVVKPSVTSIGKAAITRVRCENDFAVAWEEAHSSSASGAVDVEEFIDGVDVTVLGAVDSSGELTILAYLDELNRFMDDGALVGSGFRVPSVVAQGEVKRRLEALSARVVAAFDMRRVPFILSTRITPEGIPFVIELHVELGGDFVFEGLLPRACGVDVLDVLVRLMIGFDPPASSLTCRPHRTRRTTDGGWIVEPCQTDSREGMR